MPYEAFKLSVMYEALSCLGDCEITYAICKVFSEFMYEYVVASYVEYLLLFSWFVTVIEKRVVVC